MEQIKIISENIVKLQAQLTELEKQANQKQKEAILNIPLINKSKFKGMNILMHGQNSQPSIEFRDIILAMCDSVHILNEEVDKLKYHDANLTNANDNKMKRHDDNTTNIDANIQIKLPSMYETMLLNHLPNLTQYPSYHWEVPQFPFKICMTGTILFDKEVYISKYQCAILLMKMIGQNDITIENVAQLELKYDVFQKQYMDNVNMRNLHRKNASKCILDFISEKFDIKKSNVIRSKSDFVTGNGGLYVHRPGGHYDQDGGFYAHQHAYIDANWNDDTQNIIFAINHRGSYFVSYFVISE